MSTSTDTSAQKTGWGRPGSHPPHFLVATDQVMMPIATSAIATEFSADAGTVQAAIALVSLVAGPLYIAGGKLGDNHGKRAIFFSGPGTVWPVAG